MKKTFPNEKGAGGVRNTPLKGPLFKPSFRKIFNPLDPGPGVPSTGASRGAGTTRAGQPTTVWPGS